MASVSTDSAGRKRLQFLTPDGKRHSLKLGDIPKLTAREIGKHIEHLIRCDRTGEEPKKSTQDWAADVPAKWPSVASKLMQLGLINNGHVPDEAFADFVANYISSRRDVKPGTLKIWGQASQKVRTFFKRRTIRKLRSRVA